MPDVGLWHRCNNHCLMCTNMDSYINAADRQYDFGAQMRKLGRIASKGAYGGGEKDYVLFTGGEPTLAPHFLRLIAEYRRAMPSLPFCLLTNGRALAYEDFARKVLTALGRPLCVSVPLHGGSAASHDSITRTPGSFAQTMAGLKNLFLLRTPGQEVEIRIVLHKRTAPGFGRTLAFLLERFPDTRLYRLTLIHFEAEGQAEKNFAALRLSLTDCVSHLEAARPFLDRFRDFRLYHFPLCLLPGAWRGRAWKTLPESDVSFLTKCRRCRLRRDCPGVQKWYPERFGEGEIRPVRE